MVQLINPCFFNFYDAPYFELTRVFIESDILLVEKNSCNYLYILYFDIYLLN